MPRRAEITPRAVDADAVYGSRLVQQLINRVMLDGKAPGQDAGLDANAKGEGTVTGQRLYQLVRQKGEIEDRTFTIEFLDPGVEAFSFTFG